MADTYRLARFGERRHGALVALAVRSPVAAAEFLTSEFYSEHVSLEMRLEVLRVVHATAEELGAPTTARIGPAAARVAPAGEAPSKTPGTTPSKTRRWGTSSLRSRPVAAASVLGAVAPLYFYPLLVRFDDPTTTFTLLGEDCFLLEALLMALAALLRGVAAYPCARAMSRSLFEFGWALRYHEEPAVRRGVLVAFSAVGRAMLPALLVADLEEVLPELQEWLRARAEQDTDAGCQQLAAACHAIFGKAVRTEMRVF